MTDDIASSPEPHPLRTRPGKAVVSLVGFMGAGKTTVGRALAARLGWHFVDLDDLVQARDGRTVEQIFHQSGEPAFRELEHQILAEVTAGMEAVGVVDHSREAGLVVLGLGGGAFSDHRNQELLRRADVPAVFLDAPVEELFRRSEQVNVVRPLRREFQSFCDLYDQRRPMYMAAAYRISTAEKNIESVVTEIIQVLKLNPSRGVFQ
jgi:shikimate kinase